MKTILYIVLLLLPEFIAAQTILSGKITDTNQTPLANVQVTVLTVNDSTLIAFSVSDKDGRFQIVTTRNDREFLISIRSLSIKPQTRRIPNQTQSLRFVAEHGSFALKQVIVKPTKLWGTKDTLNYLVSAFSDKKDVVIGDVLKSFRIILLKWNDSRI